MLRVTRAQDHFADVFIDRKKFILFAMMKGKNSDGNKLRKIIKRWFFYFFSRLHWAAAAAEENFSI